MKKIFKKQDIFDISSCENIHINCKGYFFNKIPKDLVIPKSKDAFFLKVIDSLTKNCFGYVPLWESGDKAVFYPYFVPASLVFEKPEPRPFKTFKECFKKIDNLLDDEDIDVCGELGIRFDYREKGKHEMHTALVTSLCTQITDGGKEIRYLNNVSLEYWFEKYELLINGDWVPFGIEE